MLTVMVSFFLLLPNILQPFNGDNDVFQTIGWQLVHFHQLPYLGSWDQNFPAIDFYHAAIIALFGTSPIVFRSVETLLILWNAMLIFWLSRRWYSEQRSFYASIIFAVLYIAGGIWFAGQRDVFAVLCITLATSIAFRYGLLTLDGPKRGIRTAAAFLAGLLFGVAIAFRPTYLFAPAAMVAAMFLVHRRSAVRSVVALSAGGLFCLSVFVLPYVFVPGGLTQLYLAVIRYNLDVYATNTYSPPASILLTHPMELACDALLLLAVLTLLIQHKHPENRKNQGAVSPAMLLFILYMVGARFSIYWMGKFFVYHYALLLPLSALLGAYVLDSARLRLPRRLGAAMPAIAIVVGVIAVYFVSPLRHSVPALLTGRLTLSREGAFEDPVDNVRDFGKETPIVRYMKSKNVAGSFIQGWGLGAGIYWRTRTASASRFTNMHPLVLEGPHGFTDYQLRWRQEFVHSLRVVRPRFIVLQEGSILMQTAHEYLMEFPQFDSLLETNYKLDTAFMDWKVYRLVKQ